jgi:hypothetical protein
MACAKRCTSSAGAEGNVSSSAERSTTPSREDMATWGRRFGLTPVGAKKPGDFHGKSGKTEGKPWISAGKRMSNFRENRKQPGNQKELIKN